MANRDSLQQVEAEGRERLYPSLTNPNWLVLRKRRQIFSKWAQQISQRTAIVLDVGGRIQPYRSLVTTPASSYIGLDLVVTPLVNVGGNATQLPVRADCIDLALCTQMLEYAPQPQLVIDEIYRVLKPGGYLLLSAPAVYPQDSELDHWRFLPSALKLLHSKFASVEVVAEGSSVSGLVRTINVCLISFARIGIAEVLLSFTVIPLLNLFGALVDSLKLTSDTSFTANFSVLARK